MIIETSVNLKNKNKDELIALLNESLKVIQAQQAEIEHQKEKRENQKKELSILNEKQKEFNKLRNTVNSYRGQFKRQQAEIKKKDKMIEYMANFINEKTPYTKDTRILENERGVRNTKYTEQYFEYKVEEEK